MSNASLVVEHEFGNGFTLTSTTALLDDELTFGADVEATPNPVVGITSFIGTEQFSQELRIASPTDRAYDFVAGFYYDDEEGTGNDVIFLGRGFPFPPVRNSSIARAGNTLDRRSWAGFLHANLDLSERMVLFGGCATPTR